MQFDERFVRHFARFQLTRRVTRSLCDSRASFSVDTLLMRRLMYVYTAQVARDSNTLMAMNGLNGKVALITGASSGIGEQRRRYCLLDVSLSGRNEVDLQRVGDQCAGAGSERPLIVVAELTCEPDVANLVDATVEKFGRLDILVDKAVRSRDGCQRAGGVPTHDAVRSTSDRGARQHRQRVKYSRNALACRIACLQHVQVRRGTDDQLHGTGAGLEGRSSEQRQPGSDCYADLQRNWHV